MTYARVGFKPYQVGEFNFVVVSPCHDMLWAPHTDIFSYYLYHFIRLGGDGSSNTSHSVILLLSCISQVYYIALHNTLPYADFCSMISTVQSFYTIYGLIVYNLYQGCPTFSGRGQSANFSLSRGRQHCFVFKINFQVCRLNVLYFISNG